MSINPLFTEHTLGTKPETLEITTTQEELKDKLTALEYANLDAFYGDPKNDSFDLRDMIINLTPVVNQKQCGNSWAIASTNAFADRWKTAVYMETKDVIDLQFNILATTVCAKYTNPDKNGCYGGNPEDCNLYFFEKGASLSSDTPNWNTYCNEVANCCANCSTPEDIAKYPEITCDENQFQGIYKATEDGLKSLTVLVDDDTETFNVDTRATIANIKLDLIMHGPVVAKFLLYRDFQFYEDWEDGIYINNNPATNLLISQRLKDYAPQIDNDEAKTIMEGGLVPVFQDDGTLTGVEAHASYVGCHTVEIVGWNNNDGNPYWICKNSWGTNWGEDGYFKMAMYREGENINTECGLDIPYQDEEYIGQYCGTIIFTPDLDSMPNDGAICAGGCIEDNCETCVNGECVGCSAGKVCSGGQCVDESTECAGGCIEDNCETCVDGECVGCSAGKVCLNSQCVDESTDCAGGCEEDNCKECVNGECVDRCDSNNCQMCDGAGNCVGCDPGDSCVNGICVTPSTDCAGGCDDCHTCMSGECMPNCNPDDECVGGQCIPPCNGECDSICEECIDGVCENQCNNGKECVDGECVDVSNGGENGGGNGGGNGGNNSSGNNKPEEEGLFSFLPGPGDDWPGWFYILIGVGVIFLIFVIFVAYRVFKKKSFEPVALKRLKPSKTVSKSSLMVGNLLPLPPSDSSTETKKVDSKDSISSLTISEETKKVDSEDRDVSIQDLKKIEESPSVDIANTQIVRPLTSERTSSPPEIVCQTLTKPEGILSSSMGY